jgi:uncharacterized protein (TIGR03067 family)
MGALIPIVGLVVLISAVSAQEKTAHDDDFKKLQGTWNLVSVEPVAKKPSQEDLDRVKFIFKDASLTIAGLIPKNADPKKYKGVESFKIDTSKKPKEIDLKLADGDVRLGVYELDGDNLKMCWGIERKRPTKVAVDPSRKDVQLWVLKRQK